MLELLKFDYHSSINKIDYCCHFITLILTGTVRIGIWVKRNWSWNRIQAIGIGIKISEKESVC